MTQADFGTIDPAAKSGTALASDLGQFRDAVESAHKGTSRPTYAQAGMTWIQVVSGSEWKLMFFDGGADVQVGTINPAAHTFTLSFSGSIPGSSIAGGSGSGLDADTFQGKAPNKFFRTDANTVADSGIHFRMQYSVSLDTNDGKIGARLAYPGLNIYGNATEGDSVRRVTSIGTWQNVGPFSTSGGAITSATYLASGGAAYPVYGGQFRFFEGSNDTGFDWVSEGIAQFTSNGVQKIKFNSDGRLYSATYGWLEDRFAHITPAAGEGSPRVFGDCYSVYPVLIATGYEVFNAGGGQHQVRKWIQNCTEGSTNCDCNCSGG